MSSCMLLKAPLLLRLAEKNRNLLPETAGFLRMSSLRHGEMKEVVRHQFLYLPEQQIEWLHAFKYNRSPGLHTTMYQPL